MHATRPSVGISFAPRIGQPIPGYRLIRRCGRGGFAEVWEAEAPGGFRVALKLVRLSGKDPSGELRAIEVVRGIRHSNLLPIFGAWQVNDVLVIGSELADRSLWDRFLEAIAQGLRGIPRGELLGYLEAAATGLDFLNAYRHAVDGREQVGVQHRDVKPQNILLFGGSAKVADFGMVRVMDGNEASHTGSWTLPYAAPEFFRGKTSRQSDQYSLAATYCHLRGGRLPFGGTAAEITVGHMFGIPELDALPEPERPVVARALEKEPERRWPDCRAFLAALRSAGEGSAPDALEGENPAHGAALITGGFHFSSDTPVRFSSTPGFAELSDLPLDSDPTVPSPCGPPRTPRRWLRNACTSGGVAAGFLLMVAPTARPPAHRALRTITAPLPTVAARAPDPTLAAWTRAEAVGATFAASEPEGELPIDASALAALDRAISSSDALESRPEGLTGAPVAKTSRGSAERIGIGTGSAGWTRAEATGAAFEAGSGPEEGPPADATTLAAFEGAIPGREPGPTVPEITPVAVEAKAPGPAGTAPARPPSAFERGLSHLGRGEYTSAVAAFSEALQHDPAHPDAHYYRGIAHQLDQHDREAQADYSEAIRRRPGNANAYLYRGRVRSTLGLDDKALADLTEAIRLRPDDANAYLARGEVYHHLGAYDRAIADDSEAVRLRPAEPPARYLRGLARYHAGDYFGAIADFTEVIRLNPGHVGSYRYRAEAYARSGQGARAGADRDALDRLLRDSAAPGPVVPRARRPDERPTSPGSRIPRRVPGEILRAEVPRAEPPASR